MSIMSFEWFKIYCFNKSLSSKIKVITSCNVIRACYSLYAMYSLQFLILRKQTLVEQKVNSSISCTYRWKSEIQFKYSASICGQSLVLPTCDLIK